MQPMPHAALISRESLCARKWFKFVQLAMQSPADRALAGSRMLGELGDGESAAEGIPQQLAHDLIHLMAHQKMVVETQHILSRCHSDDAIVVVGSDVKLRLDILAIDEELENTLLNHDQKDPSRPFERLLERFDILVSGRTIRR